MTKLLRPAEVCDLLGISSKTLKRWRHANRLMKGVHYVQFGRHTIRYDKCWMLDFAASGGRGAHKLKVSKFLAENS